jgi:predicted RNase H-like nuclease
MTLYGIDGCKHGWVVAEAEENLSRIRLSISRQLHELISRAQRGTAHIAIDVPIGLSDERFRECDVAARRVLSRRHKSSVFPSPCRATLQARTYRDACKLNFQACGLKISKQTFGILPKVREIDLLMNGTLQRYVRETHPEVTFAALAGHGLVHTKKSARGEGERLDLLRPLGIGFSEEDVTRWRVRLGSSRLQRDDIVDALCCLATALRFAVGKELSHPGRALYDARGLKMEIVA